MGTTQIIKDITYLEGDGSYTTIARPFSLNDADLNRAFIMVNGYFYYGDWQWNYQLQAGFEKEFTYAAGATWYMLLDRVGNFADTYPDMAVQQGVAYEVISFVEFPEGTTLDFTGTVLSSLGLGGGSNPPSKELIPDTVTILVNGQTVGTSQPYLNGNFDVSGITYTSEEPIVSIGYRFTYTQGKEENFWEVNWGNYGYSPYLKLVDSVTVTPTYPVIDDPYIPILSEIKGLLLDIKNGILSLFVPDDETIQAGQDFKDDMAEVTDKIEQSNQIIEETLVKPPPEEVVPDINIIIDQSDTGYIGYMDGMSSLLASNTITNILLLMFSIAFCGYVLFGKKG